MVRAMARNQVGIAVLVLAACAVCSTCTTEATRAGPGHAVEAAPGGLTARLELDTTSIPAGEHTEGEVVVVNDTGEPVTIEMCRTPYGVGLRGDDYDQGVNWLACLQRADIPTGESRWPVWVSASLSHCTSAVPPVGDVACEPDGTAPAIPPGTYQAVVEGVEGVPIPEPVTIEVTPLG